MAQFHGSNAEGKKSYESGESRGMQWFSTRHLPAALAGLVIVALFVGVEGCSKKSGNSGPLASSQPPIPAPAPAAAPAPPASPAAAPAIRKTRKVHRRRASVITYANNDFGVSFRYPRKYNLKLGDEAQLTWPGLGPVQTDFLKPGGITVAAVEMPENSYPGTDFASAFVNLSVNSGLTSDECMQFGATDADKDPAAGDPARIEIGKLEFSQLERVTGQDRKQADVKYYHAFQNGACYEFALGLGTAGVGSAPDLAHVEGAKVFGTLEKVLSSVRFKSVEVPITAPPTDSLSTTPPAESAPAIAPSPDQPVTSNRT